MRKQLSGRELDVEFVLEGDLDELSLDVLAKYFDGWMLDIVPRTSCDYKHIKCAERMIADNVPLALILENDMFLYSNWESTMNSIQQEIPDSSMKNFLISLEDSSLKYPKGSEREKGKILYLKDYMRNCGAYLVDLGYAKAIVEALRSTPCSKSFGLYQNVVSRTGQFDIYWVHPPIAVQGTANGVFATTVSKIKSGWIGKLSWAVQRGYKRLLYRLR